MKTFFVATVFLFGASHMAHCEVPPKPFRIVSAERNFVVVSSEPATASWVAREAEQLLARALDNFGRQERWVQPLTLHVEFAPVAVPDAMIFRDEADAREQLLGAIVGRLFRSPPYWLRAGLVRNLSGRADFHPDALRAWKDSGKWLSLGTLLRREGPFADAAWQDVFAREAACFVSFLKKKRPSLLAGCRAGKAGERALRALEPQWLEWIRSAPRLMPLGPSARMSPAVAQKALARCLSVRVKDVRSGQILDGDSVTTVGGLDACCRKALARRKLLAGMDVLLPLARMDDTKATLAQDYVDCAKRIFAGQDFYGVFQELEKRRAQRS